MDGWRDELRGKKGLNEEKRLRGNDMRWWDMVGCGII